MSFRVTLVEVVDHGPGAFVAGASHCPEITNRFLFASDWTDTMGALWWRWGTRGGWLSSSGSGWTGG